MNTLDYILDKYTLDRDARPPLIIHSQDQRLEVAKLFNELQFMTGVEVGVERGYYTEILARENPRAHIIGIDPWAAYREYRDHISQEKMDRFYFDAVKLLEPFNNVELRRAYSMDAVKDFKNGELDFVYIDGNHHFKYIAQDIVEWSKKVRRGGIVSGHDFKRMRGSYKIHVKDVVQAYMYAHAIRPWFVMSGDKSPSWFYVKE